MSRWFCAAHFNFAKILAYPLPFFASLLNGAYDNEKT